MSKSSKNSSLVRRCSTGDEEAARKLFDRYAERLVLLARKRISQRLAGRVDADDVVQSVFRTFFGRLKQGRFQFEDQEDVWKLLVRITIFKTLRQVEFHGAAKRDHRLEARKTDSGDDVLARLQDREPSAEAVVSFLDEFEHFLARLPPQERQILELRLQGFTTPEIAEKLGIYDRKIRRFFERLRGLAELEPEQQK